MAVSFLLDENIEHEVLHRLNKRDYTVEHVELHPDLGKGTDDTPIAEFSRRNEWVIVTYDPDFVIDHDESDYFGAIYFENASLSAKEVSEVLHAMVSAYPNSAFRGLAFGTTEWL
jgi:predicted nuclease of predicted toxin-antitoxin system